MNSIGKQLTVIKDYTKHIVTALCVLISLFQGGFAESIWALVGILASIVLFFKSRNRFATPVLVFAAMLIAVYAVALIYHGLSFEALASMNRLLVIILLLFAFCNMDFDIYDMLFVTGLVVAAIGFAAFSTIVPWQGAVVSRRLQSVFQYANATGLFLGVAAFMTHQQEKRKSYAIVLEAAMLLTQSVGAIVIYIAGWIIYALKNKKETQFRYFLCSFAVSLFSAALAFALVYYVNIPFLGILPPALAFVFRKKIKHMIDAVCQRKFVIWAGIGVSPVLIIVLFFTRGLRPIATYLERLIQIADGVGVMLRYPLGLGPGSWRFFYPEYQSAPYSVSKIHNEYIALGVNAGFFVLVPIVLLLIYWFKHQKWDDKSICLAIILVHAFMDIPFSFLLLLVIAIMLLVDTLPQSETAIKPLTQIHLTWRFIFVIPLALSLLVLVQTVIINQAAWRAEDGELQVAAEMLDSRPIQQDNEAVLTQMALHLSLGQHEQVESVFVTLSRPNAMAYYIRALSFLARADYYEAISKTFISLELSPHNVRGFELAERIIPHLSQEQQVLYREMFSAFYMNLSVNPLYTYIEILQGGG